VNGGCRFAAPRRKAAGSRRADPRQKSHAFSALATSGDGGDRLASSLPLLLRTNGTPAAPVAPGVAHRQRVLAREEMDMSVRNLLAAVVMTIVMMSGGVGLVIAAQESPRASSPAQPVVNLNTATTSDLQKLPGVGAAMATRILEYRQKNGGFKKIEELMNVKGIGEKNFLKLKSLVTVAPPKTQDR
jgi:competence protein ComEA